MLDYSPTKTRKLLGNPDKSANPTASSPACAGLAGEHCIRNDELFRSEKFMQHCYHERLAPLLFEVVVLHSVNHMW